MTLPSLRGRLWPLVGVLAVAALWAASAYANYLAGVALADRPDMQQVIGAASVACDVMKGVALFLVIALAAKKHWVAASVACVIFALCTVWSLRSAVYFMSDAMTEKTARLEGSNTITNAKLKILDLQQQRADFLAEQTVEVDVNNKFARKDALTANKETAQEFKDLLSEVKQGVQDLEKQTFLRATVDPIADVTGADPARVIMISSLFFAVLLEMCSSWGFWLIARARADHPKATLVEAVAIVPELSPPPAPVVDDPKPAAVIQEAFIETPAPVADVAGLEAPKAKPAAKKDPAIGDLDEERVIRALQQSLVYEPGDRVLLATVGLKVNALLPARLQMNNRIAISNTLTPLISKAIPGSDKLRAGGNIWVANVRLRTAAESVTLMRSKV